jgi:allophanate hydrolase subunit 2
VLDRGAALTTVVRPGPLTTVQDLGRPGYAHLGVSPSGAADERSHRLANRLVGNPETAATLESLLGGLVLLFHCAATIAVAGAPASVTAGSERAGSAVGEVARRQRRPGAGPDAGRPAPGGSRPLPWCAAARVGAGEIITIGTPAWGLRTYLAISGGIVVPSTLGSRSCDTLSGLGPAPLHEGDQLPLGEPVAAQHWPDAEELASCCTVGPADAVVRVRRGPRDDWFPVGAFATLLASAWQVTSETNRVGVRLSGPPLRHADDAQLPSEGMVRGSIQVPTSGQPIVFLADHPTTGGYPVIGVVARTDIALLAQARPGVHVRFRSVGA